MSKQSSPWGSVHPSDATMCEPAPAVGTFHRYESEVDLDGLTFGVGVPAEQCNHTVTVTSEMVHTADAIEATIVSLFEDAPKPIGWLPTTLCEELVDLVNSDAELVLCPGLFPESRGWLAFGLPMHVVGQDEGDLVHGSVQLIHYEWVGPEAIALDLFDLAAHSGLTEVWLADSDKGHCAVTDRGGAGRLVAAAIAILARLRAVTN